MTAERSVSFDRAAGYYDATRVLPPEVHEAACDAIASELRGRGRCLEIGVGTGRIALPVAERGADLVGIDLSSAMLEKLLDKAGGEPIPLVVADATRLPFADDSFGGAFGVHVLHLIGGWQDAVRELVRVVRPGGVLLFDIGSADTARLAGLRGPAREIEDRFRAEAGIERRHPGITNIADLDDLLAGDGAAARDLPPILGTMEMVPSVLLRLFDQGIYSWTWDLDAEARTRTTNVVRSWAKERYGDLEQPQPIDVVVSFRAYDLA